MTYKHFVIREREKEGEIYIICDIQYMKLLNYLIFFFYNQMFYFQLRKKER